jgi:hypothetical protein
MCHSYSIILKYIYNFGKKVLLLNNNVQLDRLKMDNYEIVEVKFFSVCGVVYLAFEWWVLI